MCHIFIFNLIYTMEIPEYYTAKIAGRNGFAAERAPELTSCLGPAVFVWATAISEMNPKRGLMVELWGGKYRVVNYCSCAPCGFSSLFNLFENSNWIYNILFAQLLPLRMGWRSNIVIVVDHCLQPLRVDLHIAYLLRNFGTCNKVQINPNHSQGK